MKHRISIIANKNIISGFDIDSAGLDEYFDTVKDLKKRVHKLYLDIKKNKVPEKLYPRLELATYPESYTDWADKNGGKMSDEELLDKADDFLSGVLSPNYEPWEYESEELPYIRRAALRRGYGTNNDYTEISESPLKLE